MAKATLDKLNGLHDLLAIYYKDLLEEGDRLSSGELAALNAFLKNNNITVDLVESNPMQNLTEEFKKRIKLEKEA